ncbi:MAG: hypothetical protein KU28_03730 [Sulfurovum sp. PC08-66]|nr:MAG: hypothetical protein KU28_03730 [Sulfurovum sp. PC08-66]
MNNNLNFSIYLIRDSFNSIKKSLFVGINKNLTSTIFEFQKESKLNEFNRSFAFDFKLLKAYLGGLFFEACFDDSSKIELLDLT